MNRALLTLIALVAAAAAGCSDNAPRLLFAADPSISVALSQSNITVGAPLSFGAIMLCVSAPSSATIQKVSIHDPHGAMQVDAFAVRPNPMASGHEGLGALNIGLAAYGTGFAPAEPQSVRGVCPKDLLAPTGEEAAALSELGVEVHLGSGVTGGGRALDLTYTADGSVRMVTIPFGIWLCVATCPPDIGASAGSSGQP